METSRLDKLLAFIQDETNDEFLKYALATEYLRLSDTERSLFYYEDLLNNHPNYTGTYYHLGKLYEALNRKDDAIRVYEKGMEINKAKRDMHAFSELQAVYRAAAGFEEDDDDDY